VKAREAWHSHRARFRAYRWSGGAPLAPRTRSDHFAGQHRELGEAGVVLEQRAGHGDLTARGPFSAPTDTLRRRSEVHDAPVRQQVLRLPRSSVAGEVPGVPTTTNRCRPPTGSDHVPHNLLAEAMPGSNRSATMPPDVRRSPVRAPRPIRWTARSVPAGRDDDLRGHFGRADANPSLRACRPPGLRWSRHGSIELAQRRRESRESLSPAVVGARLLVVR